MRSAGQNIRARIESLDSSRPRNVSKLRSAIMALGYIALTSFAACAERAADEAEDEIVVGSVEQGLLAPSTAHLDPATLSTIVTHDNFEKSYPEWLVLAAKCGTTNLDKSKWDFSESTTPGVVRNATLTLAADASDQIGLLQAGNQIVLYVKYPGNPVIDVLNVRMP
jgi:hypothetical protein